MPGAKPNGTGGRAGLASLPGWDRLRHGGLLLDGMRLARTRPAGPRPARRLDRADSSDSAPVRC